MIMIITINGIGLGERARVVAGLLRIPRARPPTRVHVYFTRGRHVARSEEGRRDVVRGGDRRGIFRRPRARRKSRATAVDDND